MNVLLIEDEEKIARFIELELKHEGYAVTKAYDGRTGLEQAQTGVYDVILLDVMLPMLNGMEVLRRIRKNSDVPVILLTARDAVMDKVSGLDAGAAGDVKVVRRRLRPLNELAKKAEMLGSMAFDPGKFDSLEEAISNIRPEDTNASIHVGDKDLQSLEVAINNLLERMRETYRRQNRFVSDASHELRTPIAVIQGYVNMLDRWGKNDPEVLAEAIEAMKNESEHMKNLVEQLLFLARGDCGRNMLKQKEVSLSDLMREVWEEYTMIDAAHTYRLDAAPDVRIWADEAMIKQSVRIFVDNAVKYSPDRTRIRLGVREEKEEVSYLVEDEGIVMEPDEVIHVFERFYRSDAARNSRSGGTGLGLSIAQWIVQAHGGRIEVLSRPGIGTRFTVRMKKESQQPVKASAE